VNKRLTVALCQIVKVVLSSQLCVVVDLTVVDHPDVRHADNPDRLHAVEVVHNGQAVEAESAVDEVVDVLEAEAVGPAVSDLKTGGHLFVDVRV